MVGIVIATLREAQPLLDRTAAEAVAGCPIDLFRMGGARQPYGWVAISGMGKVAAAIAATHLAVDRRVAALISAGVCGCLKPQDGYSVGDLIRITAAVEGDCDRCGQGEPTLSCDAGWFRNRPEGRLVTCDRPVFDAERRARMAALGDLIDMEGAAVARVAHRYDIPCGMIKGISDSADEAGRDLLAKTIDRIAVRIAAALIEELALPQDDTPS